MSERRFVCLQKTIRVQQRASGAGVHGPKARNDSEIRRASAFLCAWLLINLVAGIAPLPAQADPALIGEWAPVQTLPWRPIHAIVLPTGKVMIYRRDEPLLWDPADGSLSPAPQFGYNPFCNGHVLLADGQVFFTGGHIVSNEGLAFASYYDPFANSMVRLPDMAEGRWYPSQVTLADGDVVTVSGDSASGRNLIPEVWEVTTSTWRLLPDASLQLPLYPAAFLAPNGKVFVATTSSRYLDTSGTGNWETVSSRQTAGRDNYGSAAMYDVGKVLYTGGGDPPLMSSEAIDLNMPTQGWNLVSPMPEPRRQQNTTILPDGRVLVTGGSSAAGFDTDDGAKAAIAWDPATDSWVVWATEAEYRGYHSEAVLLPDGRVASIGGDGHPTLQIFSPPYLFHGPRPTITSAPATIQLGDTFSVATPDSADIVQVTWIRPSAVTHTKNMNQRINKLDFTPVAGGLDVIAPASAADSPPGHYILYLINSSGVPSLGRFIHTSLGGPTPPNAPTGLTASAGNALIDLVWNVAFAAETYTVKRSESGGGPYVPIVSGITETAYTDSPLTNGIEYFYVVSATNVVGEGADSAEASATPSEFTDDFANSDIPVSGNVSGSYGDTLQNDGVDQSVQERESGGKKTNRYSYLEHKWRFDVTGGTAVTFLVNAHHTPTGDNDDFVFAYSIDDTTYTDMLTVTKTIDDDEYQLFNLPDSVSGTVFVRVKDTDQTSGNRSLDSVFVDHMYIRSMFSLSSPPAAPTGLTAAPGDAQVSLGWNAAAGSDSYNVYRSTTSGGPYASIAVGITGTAYTDVSLINGTEYYYVVTAVNSLGESDESAEASAVPQVAANMSVQSINVSAENIGKGNRRGRALVVIVDDTGAAVADATVTGSFTGDIQESGAQGTTNASGSATIDTIGTARGGVSLMFCVDYVTHATLGYTSGANAETCDTN